MLLKVQYVTSFTPPTTIYTRTQHTDLFTYLKHQVSTCKGENDHFSDHWVGLRSVWVALWVMYAEEVAKPMLDYLTAISLLALIGTHYMLVRGCFSIRAAIPEQGTAITSEIRRTAEYLDEVAQLISDLSDAGASTAVAQPQGGLGDWVASFLNTKLNAATEHATTEQQWEIHKEEIDPATTQEYQPHDDSATVPNR
jgi:hypothetical protein